MPSGTFRLKGAALLQRFLKRGFENHHQISLQARVNYPTVRDWLREEPEVESLHLPSLAGMLVDGLGMSPSEALDLRLRDLLEFVQTNGVNTK